MIYNREDYKNEVKLMEGSIRKMCATRDLFELVQMYRHSLQRLNNIYSYRLECLCSNNANNAEEQGNI